VQANDVVDSVEFEVKLIRDELDDAPYAYGGFDLGDLYIGEAYVPEFGDGVYLHTQLFGPYKDGTGEWSVRFGFRTPAKEIVRTIRTSDGDTFQTDFTFLDYKQSPESTDIRRAFFAYGTDGVERGAILSGFVVESFVGGDLRDRAPGPLYVPGSGGKVEMMCTTPPGRCESAVEQAEYALTGPGKYVAVKAVPSATNVALEVSNRLAKNGQHVHVETGLLSAGGSPGGWKGGLKEGSTSLAGGKTWTAILNVEPVPDAAGAVAPLFLNVTTDLGGRVPVVVQRIGTLVTYSVDGREPVSAPDANGGTSASLGAVACLLASAGLAMRRR
jgi:hypothetical protein